MGNADQLRGRLAVITGGAGRLGREHAHALLDIGADICLVDVDGYALADATAELASRFVGSTVLSSVTSVTDQPALVALSQSLLSHGHGIDILINNAALDPKVGTSLDGSPTALFEQFPLQQWNAELEVGLTGPFLCSQVFGSIMAAHGRGVILNIASDLSVISPDQRIYQEGPVPTRLDFKKPISYSVVKTALIGLTRYLATYWAESGVRVNALSPGGVEAGQDERFIQRLTSRIPLGRMARLDEYRGAVRFLCTDDSSYMTGQNIVMDGGRSVW